MIINTFPDSNKHLKDGIRLLMCELKEVISEADYFLFILIDRFSIGRLISERIVESTFYDRVFLLAHDSYMALALYYLSTYPGKVSLLGKKKIKKSGATLNYLTTSLDCRLKLLPITPWEYSALDFSLTDLMKGNSYIMNREKHFTLNAGRICKSWGLKINALFI